jgi:hypothetical protein
VRLRPVRARRAGRRGRSRLDARQRARHPADDVGLARRRRVGAGLAGAAGRLVLSYDARMFAPDAGTSARAGWPRLITVDVPAALP